MTRQIQPALSRIPTGVWVLGFVSMLMDISSEMIHSLLPVFMVQVLGTSMVAVGLIEGLAVCGYALGALSKPLFALASTTGTVLAARLLDRLGKGIRGAPRDAMVADLTPLQLRGAAFGLRQSLDTVGAFLGPLLAVALMLLWADNFRLVFWVAVIPGLIAVALLIFGIKKPARHATAKRINPLKLDNLKKLTRQ